MMFKMKTKKTEVFNDNKIALHNAIQIEAGKAIIDKAISMLKENPSVPMMLKMVLDTPMAAPLVGNLISFAINELMENTPKTEYAKDALIQASAHELITKLNIQKMLNSLLSGVKLPTISRDAAILGDTKVEETNSEV